MSGKSNGHKPKGKRTSAKPAVPPSPASVENPVPNPAATMPGRRGGTLKRGGVNPGSGRPPNEWKRRMEQLADRWAKAAEVQKVLDNPEHPQWMNAGRFAAEQAHGKPQQSIDVSGKLTLIMDL